ncbi:MAG: UDP-glucose 4-epimerase GalE [Firmicutes bacterium]|nr:UDP-glucose 4-epimerase GalE [Bacillota bacterium]
MRVVVTGGAGYIGSHLVARLVEQGDEVTVVDNGRTGHPEALAPFAGVDWVALDVSERDALAALLRARGIQAVYHFAAWSLVAESMSDPLRYYRNNVAGTEALLSAMVAAGVRDCIFSSTAAVYGAAGLEPLTEDQPCAPTNPYGETKLAIERMLAWAWRAYGIRSVSLRYFNAAGAHDRWPIGEDHRPETHLLPTLLGHLARGEATPVSVYGTDYPTPDGTAIRDYIHVMDLAEVHVRALAWLQDQAGAYAFNVGSGCGYSVRDVIRTVERVTGRTLIVREGPRRPGDPPHLVAAIDAAGRELGWRPQHSDLEFIVDTAWAWHRAHPHGYDPV